ncbi:MAG: hypothetical protein R3D05_00575 [Dongiaceae bacterium]
MRSAKEQSNGPQYLSPSEVAGLVGGLGREVIAAILATGADYAEIEQAQKWIGTRDGDPRQDLHELTPRAERVCDILLECSVFDGCETPDVPW